MGLREEGMGMGMGDGDWGCIVYMWIRDEMGEMGEAPAPAPARNPSG